MVRKGSPVRVRNWALGPAGPPLGGRLSRLGRFAVRRESRAVHAAVLVKAVHPLDLGVGQRAVGAVHPDRGGDDHLVAVLLEAPRVGIDLDARRRTLVEVLTHLFRPRRTRRWAANGRTSRSSAAWLSIA